MELHSLFSFFEPGSDIFRLNEQAGTEPVPVRQDTLFVLTHALDYGRETQGTFAPLFSYREIPCFRRDIFSSILTAYKNAGGEIELHQALAEMMNRGKSVPGGACGFWGACGAGISTGMFV